MPLLPTPFVLALLPSILQTKGLLPERTHTLPKDAIVHQHVDALGFLACLACLQFCCCIAIFCCKSQHQLVYLEVRSSPTYLISMLLVQPAAMLLPTCSPGMQVPWAPATTSEGAGPY